MTGAIAWLPEAGASGAANSPGRRAQRAGAAATDVARDQARLDAATLRQLLTRLQTLKTSLQARLLDGITDFRRFQVSALLADVDRLITQATADLAQDAERQYIQASDLGVAHVQEPLAAAQLDVARALPGVNSDLVQSAFGNTVDLLTVPMQQFGSGVKQALRGVALAGDNRQDAINRLRDQISGQGFDSAAFKAERIIRTELSRTFNGATYAALVSQAQAFPFLKKGWRASKDNRTRLGHRQAAQTYARGQGILIAQSFAVQVYDERPGQAPKLIGTALLKYPVDPDTVPGGRIAAGATIMCRCNAFVDIDLAAFGAYTQAKVALVSPGVPPPALPPVPPLPKPNPPAVAPPKLKVPKVRAPKVVKAPLRPPKAPTAAQVTPIPTAGPTGTKVSAAMRIQAGFEKVAEALAVLDRVHGDGALPTIPVGELPKRFRARAAAGYIHGQLDGRAITIGYSKKVLKQTPFITVFHETGHYLDHQGLGVRTFASQMPTGLSTDLGQAMDGLRTALKNSQAIQRLKLWNGANLPGSPHTYGDGVVPNTVNRRFVNYLLSSTETFARAYAQYVAVKSEHPAALKELRATQAASNTALQNVPKWHRYNPTAVSGAKMPDGTWDYPWQWQDADFNPIEAAFDRVFEVMGWRTR